MEDAFPWRQWMKGALGALHWSPETFWRSTITEYMMAIEGFNEMNGEAKKNDGPSDADISALLTRYGG
ncbi:phage tail assembly chaperone [Mesorhizobium sp. B2-4-8]|uniref:phage tail assembly chaperone n=1 Tax=Mesorhizobium sp. B2-4-8 TaxID=2589941 RepID=UPI00112841A3|nr:phage tail assembly chaperone [Mesorhizobium sp. B2-4-8]TPL36747.1 phage tail assembly chaperone [Mesorhizobium sp. B2-4-8]